MVFDVVVSAIMFVVDVVVNGNVVIVVVNGNVAVEHIDPDDP